MEYCGGWRSGAHARIFGTSDTYSRQKYMAKQSAVPTM
jgi:hypothetical protein